MSTNNHCSENRISRTAVCIAVIAAVTMVVVGIFRQELPMMALDLLGIAVIYYSLVGAWNLAFGHRTGDDYETAAGIIHHLENPNHR